MELVFIHGWGFDVSFWDPLAALLGDYPQRRIDRGYFGKQQGEVKSGVPAILIGHSLGFVYGLSQRQDWAGLIAINSFARFADCVPSAALREMRIRLAADPEKTLKDFYALIGAHMHAGTPDIACLSEGLDELRDIDLNQTLLSLAVPFFILASRNDALVPVKASEALAEQAPRARLAWHQTGNHMLPQSDAVWCAQMIKDFVIT